MLMAVPFPGLHLMMDGKAAPPAINGAWQVFTILGIYIAFIINYYVNQMCGRARSGLLQALVSVITFWLLTSSFWDYWCDLFYLVFPAPNALAVIAGDIFGTGLREVELKAVPHGTGPPERRIRFFERPHRKQVGHVPVRRHRAFRPS
jgi:hypothetical protein